MSIGRAQNEIVNIRVGVEIAVKGLNVPERNS